MQDKNKKHIKNFESWNKKKIILQNVKEETLLCKVGEVWWCSLGVNIGDEQDGKNQNFERPILVYKKFNTRFIIGVPLTSNENENFFIKNFSYSATDLNILKSGQVIISQTRPLSTKRLLRKMGKVSYDEFGEIRKLVKEIF